MASVQGAVIRQMDTAVPQQPTDGSAPVWWADFYAVRLLSHSTVLSHRLTHDAVPSSSHRTHAAGQAAAAVGTALHSWQGAESVDESTNRPVVLAD